MQRFHPFVSRVITSTFCCSHSLLLASSAGSSSLDRGLLAANRADLNSDLISDDLLDGNSLAEPLEGVSPLKLLELDRSVLVQELVDGEETTADLDLDLVCGHLHVHALGAKLVDAL